ncbi:hypothetical protein Tsubulata_029918 [Turnera subulata]|uniref:Uncharacterized protein n=1 Tax=Turnera subulata TaxID=218843 RepID=A0A9Q0JDS0_9ROSI|nr:hypothetical protein Tsubulata_029918 [Turnera subulata]
MSKATYIYHQQQGPFLGWRIEEGDATPILRPARSPSFFLFFPRPLMRLYAYIFDSN